MDTSLTEIDFYKARTSVKFLHGTLYRKDLVYDTEYELAFVINYL